MKRVCVLAGLLLCISFHIVSCNAIVFLLSASQCLTFFAFNFYIYFCFCRSNILCVFALGFSASAFRFYLVDSTVEKIYICYCTNCNPISIFANGKMEKETSSSSKKKITVTTQIVFTRPPARPPQI